MRVASSDFGKFTHSLWLGKDLVIQRGKWRERTFLEQVRKRRDDLKIVQFFNRRMDVVQSLPVVFGQSAFQTRYVSLLSTLETVNAQAVLPTASGRKIQRELALRIVSLRYRVTAANGGQDPLASGDVNLFNQLQQKAAHWKQKSKLVLEKELTAIERQRLSELARYPEYVRVVLQNPKALESTLKYALKDNIDPAIICEYREELDSLHRNYLAPRIGGLANQILRIHRANVDGVEQKQIQLMFEGQWHSLHNKEKLIHFSDGSAYKISHILKDFATKNVLPGNFECFTDGIRPWNIYHWGSIRGKSLAPENRFWEKLPPVDIRSQAYVEQRYGVKIQSPDQWVLVLAASRQAAGTALEDTHGYVIGMVPAGDGHYKIYPFAKFPTHYPKNVLEKIFFPGKTVKAAFAYPDPNYFYSHRQHAARSWAVAPAVGELFMHWVANIRKAESVFQFPWDNCAFTSQKIFLQTLGEKVVGNPFRRHFVESKPVGPLGVLRNAYARAPKRLQPSLIKGLNGLMATWRGITINENGHRKRVSVANTPFGKKGTIYLPPILHEDIIAKRVSGVVWHGHLPKVSV